MPFSLYSLLFTTAMGPTLGYLASAQLVDRTLELVENRTGYKIAPKYNEIASWKRAKEWLYQPLYILNLKARIAARQLFRNNTDDGTTQEIALLEQQIATTQINVKDVNTIRKNAHNVGFKSIGTGALASLPFAALWAVTSIIAPQAAVLQATLAGASFAAPLLASFGTALKGHTGNLLAKALYGVKRATDTPGGNSADLSPVHGELDKIYTASGAEKPLNQIFQEEPIEEIQGNFGGKLEDSLKARAREAVETVAGTQEVNGPLGFVEKLVVSAVENTLNINA